MEYKLSHVFDKAFESICGFVTTLPYNFSAYNWAAIKGTPLWDHYFKRYKYPEKMGPYESNVNLVSDRVLGLYTVLVPESKYLLRYVRGSVANFEIPNTVHNFLENRKK